MRPSSCNARMYPCVFVNCDNKVCYKCFPGESFPYLCTEHRKIILKFYLKMKEKCPFLNQKKMFNFKQWRFYEKYFPIKRWPVFLMEYSVILRKYENSVRKYINKRYLHYFDFFIAVPDCIKSEYHNIILEEEWISDQDDVDDENDTAVEIWNPYLNAIFPLHKDRDY